MEPSLFPLQEPPPHQAPLPLPKIAIQPTEVIVETTAEALGQQFCQWFFELLNSQNPSWGKTPQDWGPQHFWTDAKLNILARYAYLLHNVSLTLSNFCAPFVFMPMAEMAQI